MAKDYWLFQRGGSDRWVFAWAPDPANKAKRKQKQLPPEIRTEREATAYAETHEDALKGEPPKRTRTTLTVADVADRWTKLRKDDARFSASTFKDAASHLRRWIVPMVGTKPAMLDVPSVRAWVRALKDAKGRGGKRIAPYTIRNVLRSLKWLLADAIGEGWIQGPNPADADAVHDELPKTMEPRAGTSQRLRIRDVKDAQRLIDCARLILQWRVRYCVAMLTGLRDGELSGLRWRDVTEESLRVRVALQLKTRDGHAKLGSTKTRQSMRTVPLHAAAHAALEEWRTEGWEIHVGRAPTPDDFVFVKRNGKAWRPRSAERFRKHLELAGLPTEVEGHALTFHALRRSFVNWLRAKGVPPEARQALMGHEPKTVEERHYSEEDPAALAEFVSRIAVVWNRVATVPCGKPPMDDKPLHSRARMRKVRRDHEG